MTRLLILLGAAFIGAVAGIIATAYTLMNGTRSLMGKASQPKRLVYQSELYICPRCAAEIGVPEPHEVLCRLCRKDS